MWRKPKKGRMRWGLCLAVLLLAAVLVGCRRRAARETRPTVAAGIVPVTAFVNAVAGELVYAAAMIPPGYSPETYSPTPQTLECLSDASLYFSTAMPTEVQRIIPKAPSLNPGLRVVDLAAEVRKVYPDRYFAPRQRDPHIWLSIKRAKVMVEVIARELSARYPEHASAFAANAKAYQAELETGDREVRAIIARARHKTFVVFHASFGYFADDYGLTMVALEQEGREASPKDLERAIDAAKREGITVIFYQAGIDSRQARAFAEEINGTAVKLDPLSADYIANFKRMAEAIAAQGPVQ